jgi:alpha-tubulin suppressor-like RCC1 family protein
MLHMRKNTLRFALLVVAAAGASALAVVACTDDPTPGAGESDASAEASLADASRADTSTSSDGALDAPQDVDAGDASSSVTCAVSPCAVRIAAGNDHACAVMSDKTVRCWGANYWGQAGQVLPTDGGQGAPLLTAVPVPGLASVRTITLGAEHSCALLDNDQVRCWGSNKYAQLGQPADGGESFTATLATVATTGTLADISAGFFHTCVLRADGTIQCWGNNQQNQIGALAAGGGSLGNYVDMPTESGLTGVKQLDVGGRFGCGLLGDGGVSCWGTNANGELGRGTTGASDPASAAVVGIPGVVTRVGRSLGYGEGIILSDQTVRLWGYNNKGQLGPATDAGSTGTMVALGLGGVVDLGIGASASCALTTDGGAACWGGTTSGVVGVDPDAGPSHPEPVQVGGVSDAVQLAVAWDGFACALRKNGSVVCWGNNYFGNLGRGVDYATLPYDIVAKPVLLQ